MKDLIFLNRQYYDEVEKTAKAEMTGDLLQFFKSNSIRFLEKDSNGIWVEAPKQKAREKISMIFRDQRKAAVKQGAVAREDNSASKRHRKK